MGDSLLNEIRALADCYDAETPEERLFSLLVEVGDMYRKCLVEASNVSARDAGREVADALRENLDVRDNCSDVTTKA